MAISQYQIYLRALSPLHVGGAQEKNLQNGVDYFIQKSGYLHILDVKSILEKIPIQNYCDALVGDPKSMHDLISDLDEGDLNKLTKKRSRITGNSNIIKSMPVNAISGKPFIPGSSIKGSLSSMILNKLINKDNGHLNNEKPEEKYLGTFENSIMRFIHISDVDFDKTKYYNSKIFNLFKKDGMWHGGWKHSPTNNTNSRFNKSGFTTIYECIPLDSIGSLSLRYNTGHSRSMDNIPELAKKIFKYDSNVLEILKTLIKNYTDIYLDREISFFSKFKINETTQIISFLKNLKTLNTYSNPVFRMGAGSGYHSITGDWNFADHIITVEGNNKIKYKSRKFAFEADTANNIIILPFGFIQLLSEEFYEKIKREKQEKDKQIEREKKQKQLEVAEKKRVEEKKLQEARKPIFRSISQIKSEKIVDGIVVGQSGTFVRFKAYIEGGSDDVYEVRYARGFPIDTIITVKVEVSRNNKLTNFSTPKKKA